MLLKIEAFQSKCNCLNLLFFQSFNYSYGIANFVG